MTASYDYFPHNWVASCLVETRYKTQITFARDNMNEERRSFSDRPYRSVALRWSGMSKTEQTRMINALWRAGGQRTYVPIYPDQQATSASSSATTINAPTADSRFAVGAEVLIVARDGVTQERRTIQSFTGSAITLTVALTNTYAAGSLVYPMILAEVMPRNSYAARTRTVGDVDATFVEVFGASSLPASAVPTAPGVLGATTSDANRYAPATTPVLGLSPDLVESVEIPFTRIIDVADQGNAPILSARGLRASFGFDFLYTTTTKAQSADLLRFFDSRKGRLLPFWVVNPMVDWTLSSIATTHVDITQVGNIADFQDGLEYVAIVMNDGTVYIRRIRSVAAGGGNFAMDLYPALPVLSSSDVARVTSAHFCRFEKDSLTQEAITDRFSRFRISIAEILYERQALEIFLPAPLLTGAGCAPDYSGGYTVCYIAYRLLVGGDCGPCMIGHNFEYHTVLPGDPGIITVAAAIASGFFDDDDGSFRLDVGSCVGQGSGNFSLELKETDGYVKVYEDDSGTGMVVYANIRKGFSGPPACDIRTDFPDLRAFVPCHRIKFPGGTL